MYFVTITLYEGINLKPWQFLLNFQVISMDDLVKDSAVFDLVLSVAEEQMARGKPFFDTLSKTLGVQADYNVSQILIASKHFI